MEALVVDRIVGSDAGGEPLGAELELRLKEPPPVSTGEAELRRGARDLTPQQLRDLLERRGGGDDDGVVRVGVEEPEQRPRRDPRLAGVVAGGDERLLVVADGLEHVPLLRDGRAFSEEIRDELPRVALYLARVVQLVAG